MNSYMKVIINSLKQWVNDTLTALDKKLTKRIETTENDMVKSVNNTLPDENGNIVIETGSKQIQADYEQNDSASIDYIKNRPVYTGEAVETEFVDINALLAEHELEWSEQGQVDETNYMFTAQMPAINFIEGTEYIISFDGIKYSDTAKDLQESLGAPFKILVLGDYDKMGQDSVSDFRYIVQSAPTQDMAVIQYKGATPPTECKIYEFKQEIKKLDRKYLPMPEGGYGYDETVQQDIVPEVTISGFTLMQDPFYGVQNVGVLDLIAGETYTVTWDGDEYELACGEFHGMPYIGNSNYVDAVSGGDIPFAIVAIDGQATIITESTEESHILKISGAVTETHKISEKYLPELPEIDPSTLFIDPNNIVSEGHTGVTYSWSGNFDELDNYEHVIYENESTGETYYYIKITDEYIPPEIADGGVATTISGSTYTFKKDSVATFIVDAGYATGTTTSFAGMFIVERAYFLTNNKILTRGIWSVAKKNSGASTVASTYMTSFTTGSNPTVSKINRDYLPQSVNGIGIIPIYALKYLSGETESWYITHNGAQIKALYNDGYLPVLLLRNKITEGSQMDITNEGYTVCHLANVGKNTNETVRFKYNEGLSTHYIQIDASGDVTIETTTDDSIEIPEGFSGDYNDLTNKPTIPSIDGLATETYVDTQLTTKIDNIPQVDWEQNDSTASDYIKNRPFHETRTYEVPSGYDTAEVGAKYVVEYDGKYYDVEIKRADDPGGVYYYYYVGNPKLIDDVFAADESYPFCYFTGYPGGYGGQFNTMWHSDDSVEHTYTLYRITSTTVTTIDEKFIPDTIARVSDVSAPKTEFILASSTEGSTKQFKITIDDAGTLTVTEVEQTTQL